MIEISMVRLTQHLSQVWLVGIVTILQVLLDTHNQIQKNVYKFDAFLNFSKF